MNPDPDFYKKEFFQEVREIIETTVDSVLKLESDPQNDDLLNSIFRGVHNIKGSAGTFEVQEISDFTHHLESLLNALRDGRVAFVPEMADVILSGVDHIGHMLAAREKGTVMEGDAELERRFRSFYDAGDTKTDSGTDAPAATACEAGEKRMLWLEEADRRLLPEALVSAMGDAVAKGLTVCRIELFYTSELLENGYDPAVFLKNLRRACELYHAVVDVRDMPHIDSFEPLALYLKPLVYTASGLSVEDIKDLCFDQSLVDIVELTRTSGSPHAIPGEDMREALLEFALGAGEMLESAEQAAIVYERDGQRGALDEIFRVAHNIKGDADFVGLKELAAFAHAFESMLEHLRAGRIQRTAEVVDQVLKGLDYFRACLSAMKNNRPQPPLPPLYDHLLQQKPQKRKDTFLPEASSNMREVYTEQLYQYRRILNTALKAEKPTPGGLRIVGRALDGLQKASGVAKHTAMQDLSRDALDAFNAATPEDPSPLRQSLSAIVAYINSLDAEPKRIGEILVADGKIAQEELDEYLARQKPIGQMLVEEGKLSEIDLEQALKKQELMEVAQQMRGEDAGDTAVRTMRVDERKIEQFTNTVGEMLIARNTYAYLIDQLEHARDGGDARETVKALKENLHLFSRLSNDIHHGVISLRMIPVRGIFQKFTRVVRDICRKQKKMIQLMTDGEDIEIDKKVADSLSDPLVHLVRNACDHGIEPPLDRKKVGKPEKGTLLLRAAREGSNITIRIIDDGRGIDRQRLFDKAQAAGMQVASMDDPALLTAIFLPGLSTAAEITDVSGRGVGMDVVKTTVESLGGHVRVSSDTGRGTEIVLSIPTTLGIDTVLFVEAGGRSYAIPIGYIVETLRLPADRFRRAGALQVFHYRGEVLSAHKLTDLLGDRSSSPAEISSRDSSEEVSLVILRTSHGKRGLIIDRLDKNMEIAVKPLPHVLAELDIIAGVSIMGDGKVLLVLNPERME